MNVTDAGPYLRYATHPSLVIGLELALYSNSTPYAYFGNLNISFSNVPASKFLVSSTV